MLRQNSEICLQLNLVEESFYLVARKGKEIIMFARTKGQINVHYNICSNIPFNEQQKCHVTNIYTVEEE